jgi:hypothetical protein
MADTPPLDEKTLRRLGDLVAMVGSPNKEEGDRVREHADRLLKQHGKSMVDLGEILRTPPPRAAPDCPPHPGRASITNNG